MKIENINDRYLSIESDEGMVLTEWKEGDDIMDYSGAKKMFSPLTYDTNKLREITDAEHTALLNEQEIEALKRNGE